MANNQSKQIVTLLTEKGPLTSDELAHLIMDKGIATTDEASRKAITRAVLQDAIKTTAPVRFNKTYLYYLKAHEGKKYASAIIKILPNKPSFHRVYKTILANKGWITYGQIMKSASGVPGSTTGKYGGRLKEEELIDQLKRLKIIREWNAVPGLYICEDGFKRNMISASTFCRWIRSDQLLMPTFVQWCRNCLLMGWNDGSYNQSEFGVVPFNSCYWDLVGPTYFGPYASTQNLAGPQKQHQAFIISDVQGYREYSRNDAECFLDRIKNILCVWKNISLIPVVLAGGYSKEAFNDLKSKGVIPLTIDAVYGSKFGKFMQLYYEIISESYNGISFDKLAESLKLSDIVEVDDALKSNIKGDLFELIISMAYKHIGYDTTMNKIVSIASEQRPYEIDIVAIKRESECLIIECKGRNKESLEDIDEIKKHFGGRCKAAADEVGWDVVNRYKIVKAIFITTGILGSDAEVYVKKTLKSHGIECSVMRRDQVMSLLEETGEPALVALVNQYY